MIKEYEVKDYKTVTKQTKIIELRMSDGIQTVAK